MSSQSTPVQNIDNQSQSSMLPAATSVQDYRSYGYQNQQPYSTSQASTNQPQTQQAPSSTSNQANAIHQQQQQRSYNQPNPSGSQAQTNPLNAQGQAQGQTQAQVASTAANPNSAASTSTQQVPPQSYYTSDQYQQYQQLLANNPNQQYASYYMMNQQIPQANQEYPYPRYGSYAPNYNSSGYQGAGQMPTAGQPNAAMPQQVIPQQSDALSALATSNIGQIQPVGLRPKVTTTMWEDEKTLCYQVEANNVPVVRRADNNMINGTKLLNVAHMTRGRRDGILKSEKIRHVVKIGSMHLKGVWIPFERALAMAQREGIVDLLYPLFVRDIKRVIQQSAAGTNNAFPVGNGLALNYYQQAPAYSVGNAGSAVGQQATQAQIAQTQVAAQQVGQIGQASQFGGQVPQSSQIGINQPKYGADSKDLIQSQINGSNPQQQQQQQLQQQQQQQQQQQAGYYPPQPYYSNQYYQYPNYNYQQQAATAGTQGQQPVYQYNYGGVPQQHHQPQLSTSSQPSATQALTSQQQNPTSGSNHGTPQQDIIKPE